MRIFLHIGAEECGAARLQSVLADKRGQLARKGIVFPRIGGTRNQTRIYMAVSDPEKVDILRYNRGLASPQKQARAYASIAGELEAEAQKSSPDTLILSASQLITLPSRTALERLRALLLPLSEDITIVAHVDEQARLLARHYEAALWSGRTAPLGREMALAEAGNWFETALRDWQEYAPERQGFAEIQAPPFWLDYTGLQARWEAVFGKGSMRFRAYDPARFYGGDIIDEIRQSFDISENIGKAAAGEPPTPLSAASLARLRQMNELLVALLHHGKVIPRQLWRRLLGEVTLPGAPLRPGSLGAVSRHFRPANTALAKAHPGLGSGLRPDRALKPWQEADPGFGFRASQYAAAFLPRIDKATRQARPAPAPGPAATLNGQLSEVAEKLLSEPARQNYAELRGGRFEPHNDLSPRNEEKPAPPFTEIAPRQLPRGNSGRVIVGCMKDEAPYILEWIAYHRAIGIDNFIIYTNGCSDGTPEILERLQELGIVQHRDNNEWKGNSPQQHALNQSLKEPLIRNAEWVIHIDVDEYMNIRCGNGTLDDLLARVPNATNIAMTWRLFGHNGITRLSDDLVIRQFTHAAPKYCPKPHTVWGFKTMVKNIGAYGKLSCHRPNKLVPEQADKVVWVNGSGRVVEGLADNGWRSSTATIGYNLIQLNHYALRSAESYLIKRQRGRALHVDRSIGLSYWIRMDWSDHQDLTIQRNIPRLEAGLAQLKSDRTLAELHEKGLQWHRAKARELHENPEFEDLYTKALATRLRPLERVAYALALDVDS